MCNVNIKVASNRHLWGVIIIITYIMQRHHNMWQWAGHVRELMGKTSSSSRDHDLANVGRLARWGVTMSQRSFDDVMELVK